MMVYVLHDCVDVPYEYALAGIENVYANYEDAYARMEELYNSYLEKFFSPKDARKTFIDGYEAQILNTDKEYRHTWTIAREEVV